MRFVHLRYKLSYKLEYSFFNLKDLDEIIGESKYVKNLNNIISSVSRNKTSVLLFGERGTGKKQIAKIIHAKSSNNPYKSIFIDYDCINQNDDLFENLINDLENNLQNNFENITVFFENIDCLDLSFQEKLISYVKKSNTSNYRFIFSAETSLEELVENHRFDSNLYFLISTVLINTVSLEQRKEDISVLSKYYFEKFNKSSKVKFNPFSEMIEKKLTEHFWRGNVEELKLCIQKAFLTANASNFTFNDLGFSENTNNDISGFVENQLSGLSESSSQNDSTLKTAVDNFKKEYVTKVLEENNWNQTKTAKILGIQRTYVIKLINDLNIRK